MVELYFSLLPLIPNEVNRGYYAFWPIFFRVKPAKAMAMENIFVFQPTAHYSIVHLLLLLFFQGKFFLWAPRLQASSKPPANKWPFLHHSTL